MRGLFQATRWTSLKMNAPEGQRGKAPMETAGVQKKQTGEPPSLVRALWDPFGFMQAMFGWGRSATEPSFEVKETDDTYVCKVKVQLTLPNQADMAHAKAELDRGELTLVVPKAAAAERETASPPRKTRRAKGSGKGSGSARHTPRRRARTPARRA